MKIPYIDPVWSIARVSHRNARRVAQLSSEDARLIEQIQALSNRLETARKAAASCVLSQIERLQIYADFDADLQALIPHFQIYLEETKALVTSQETDENNHGAASAGAYCLRGRAIDELRGLGRDPRSSEQVQGGISPAGAGDYGGVAELSFCRR